MFSGICRLSETLLSCQPMSLIDDIEGHQPRGPRDKEMRPLLGAPSGYDSWRNLALLSHREGLRVCDLEWRLSCDKMHVHHSSDC